MPVKSETPCDISRTRRRRLWELPRDCHCPLIGVCLPLHILRKLVNQAVGAQVVANDYQVHVGAVSECNRRTRISNALQRELDRRYAVVIRKFGQAKAAQAVEQLWQQAAAHGEITGALWAALTHPCCDAAVQEAICRDIHMIQHQAGAHARADMAKVQALESRVATLKNGLETEQEHSRRLLAEKNAEIVRLSALLMNVQANMIGKDTIIHSLQARLAEWQAMAPDLEARVRLKEKNEQLGARHTMLKQEIGELKHELAVALQHLDAVNQPPPATPSNDLPAQSELQTVVAMPYLNEKTVLCVGGRTGNVATYRALIEREGGKFTHHDGGLEHHPSLLDTSLAAADLVICQSGCISHNAYWRVKDFCKRTGKQCMFVESPSVSGLARALTQIPGMAGEELTHSSAG